MRKQPRPPLVLVKRRRQWTEADKKDILSLYDNGSGMNISGIAKKYDVNHMVIRNWLYDWGVYNPHNRVVENQNHAFEKESTLEMALRLLDKRVTIDFITDDIKFYYLDGKRINPYYLIPAAGLCKGRAWV